MSVSDFEIGVIGLGPAGLGAVANLTRSKIASNIICFESGVSADSKFCTILRGKGCRHIQPCQIISGVGGCSVLSGGKVSAFPAGRSMSDILTDSSRAEIKLREALIRFQRYIPLIAPDISQESRHEALKFYQQHGFEFRYYDAYLYRQEDLIHGYNQILTEAINAGISIQLETQVYQILPVENGFHISTIHDGNSKSYFCKKLIVAVGRIGTELLTHSHTNLALGGHSNQCDIGVRLEFPVSLWPDINSCHNDLKLHFHNARTFCVCKDGYLAPYRLKDIFILEGHSDPDKKTGFTNLALSVRHQLEISANPETPLNDIRLRLLKNTGGRPIRQRLVDYLSGHPSKRRDIHEPSSISYWLWGNVNDCFSEDIADRIRETVIYFVSRLMPRKSLSNVSVFAPEIDYYWPKFPIDQNFESIKPNLYLIGDCAGHFRGILQAFCSGLECAEHIIRGSSVQK